MTGRAIGRSLIAAVLLVGIGVGLSWYVGGELMAPVPRRLGPPPDDLVAEAVTIPSASGSLVHGWFSVGAAGQGAVLLLHGLRGDRRDMLARATFLHRLGYAVLLIDFQAHGESPGQYITFGDLESRDATAAIEFLHRRVPSERVGVIGVSLGAAAVVLAQPRPHVDALILESMFPTVSEAVRDRLRLRLGAIGPVLAPLLLLQLHPRLGISADRLRPIDHVGTMDAPVFILSGTVDRHTSIAEARSLFQAASAPKELWAVEGAAHVDLHQFAVREYERRVTAFLSEYLHKPEAAPIVAQSY
jgi:uncharacterized protein